MIVFGVATAARDRALRQASPSFTILRNAAVALMPKLPVRAG
jgi:hypothetical protein